MTFAFFRNRFAVFRLSIRVPPPRAHPLLPLLMRIRIRIVIPKLGHDARINTCMHRWSIDRRRGRLIVTIVASGGSSARRKDNRERDVDLDRDIHRLLFITVSALGTASASFSPSVTEESAFHLSYYAGGIIHVYLCVCVCVRSCA